MSSDLGRALRRWGLAAGVALTLLAACATPSPQDRISAPVVATTARSPGTEILWDTWGVPHIYAESDEELFRALGWAQTRSHGDLLLELYGRARGRASEYEGETGLASDRWVRTMGIPERAQLWYSQQSPTFRRLLDAFAAGINEYAETHPDQLSERARRVLPVYAVDVIAHTQRVIHFSFVSQPFLVEQARQHVGDVGSNAWAIAPSRSGSGNAMLLINPHLAWSGQQLFYEVHLVAPGVESYGATLIGFPVIALGFNRHLGWTHTVNTLDGADAFELTLSEGGYRFDGAIRAFETEQHSLRVRRADGTYRTEPLSTRRAVHGPVVAERGGKAVALRVVGLDAPGMLEQWWDMSRATDLGSFETALRRLQVPMFNVLYADRDGHVLYVFNGRVPRRSGGTYLDWQGVIDGQSSANMWTDVLSYDELPRVLDPPSGWLQNANDPPWTATFPAALDPARFPSYIAPRFMHFRAQQSATLLASDASITFEELVAYKHSTRMLLADRMVDDLVAAARSFGDATTREAADVLSSWDRHADANSRGAVLFDAWAQRMNLARAIVARDEEGRRAMQETFTTPWDPAAPFTTPAGLKAKQRAVDVLREVAGEMIVRHGSMSESWGKVHRLRRGSTDLPANGADGDPGGVFRTTWFAEAGSDGQRVAEGGDTFYAAVEFSEPVRARVLLAYGNSTQVGSPHVGDQLDLYARNEMRVAWLDRSDIEANLETRDVLAPRTTASGVQPVGDPVALDIGTHAVGFRVFNERDYSRAFGRLAGPERAIAARPMQISVWYPAEVDPVAPRLRLRDYLVLSSREIDFAANPENDVRRALTRFRVELSDEVLDERSLAHYDAAVAKGKFPLILYAPSLGAPAAENIALCEYLASHGYVVVATPAVGMRVRQMVGNGQDLYAQVADLAFLLSYMRGFPGADLDRVGTVGFSWGGLSNIVLAMQDARVKAVVSLDGSISFKDHKRVATESVLYDADSFRVPLLAVTQSPGRHAQIRDFSFVDEFTYADVQLLHVHDLVHLHFSSTYTKLFGFMPDEGDAPTRDEQRILRGYWVVSRYTREFLDTHLKRSESAATFLQRAPPANGIPDEVLTITRKRALAAPPMPDEFVEIIREQGAYAAKKMFLETRARAPDYVMFVPSQLIHLAAELESSGRVLEAAEVLELAILDSPSNYQIFERLALLHAARGSVGQAEETYKRFGELNPESIYAPMAAEAARSIRRKK